MKKRIPHRGAKIAEEIPLRHLLRVLCASV
jgi:hypothetical protein